MASNNEFFEALSMLTRERGITPEYLLEKIEAAIVIAVKKNYEVEEENVLVEIDPGKGKFNVSLVRDMARWKTRTPRSKKAKHSTSARPIRQASVWLPA